MPIIPRAPEAGDDVTITSPGVATTTVVGMVLGVMCLFAIVVSYQLISCPWRKKKQRRVPRHPPIVITTIPIRSEKPRSFRSRILSVFKRSHAQDTASRNISPSASKTTSSSGGRGLKTLYLSITKSNRSGDAASTSSPPSTPVARAPTIRERRLGALRSLHLNTNTTSPRKRYPVSPSPSPMSATVKRMGRVFQFDSSPPATPTSTPSGWFSPRPPKTPLGRRHYKQLDDSKYSEEAAYHMRRPADALISPWSPNEGQYPAVGADSLEYTLYSPGYDPFASDPGTPLPLYPPPPAYLPDTPLRGTPGSAPPSPSPLGRLNGSATPTRWFHCPVPEPPVSPIVSCLSEEIDGEIVSWDLQTPSASARGRSSPEMASAAGGGVFVISNDTDDEDDALESVSMYTNDEIEPLTL